MEPDLTDLKLLIKKITSDVVGNMLMQPGGTISLNELHPSKGNSILVLIPEFVGNLNEFINYLGEKYPEHEFVFGTAGNIEVSSLKQTCEAVNINDEASRQKLYSRINKFEAVFLISPGVMQLKAVVDGDDRSFIEKIMIHQLLHGRQAGILLDYDIKDMTANSLTKKIKELLESLKSMGISVSILNEQMHNEQVYQEKKLGDEKGKRLITEKDVQDLFKSGTNVIQIGHECIITPMARDKANELKMKIII